LTSRPEPWQPLSKSTPRLPWVPTRWRLPSRSQPDPLAHNIVHAPGAKSADAKNPTSTNKPPFPAVSKALHTAVSIQLCPPRALGSSAGTGQL
jgi:hypothetical protein